MATERVEQQLKEIDAEGPLTKYVNKQTVWGIIATALFVFAVWEMRPAVRTAQSAPPPKQTITDAPSGPGDGSAGKHPPKKNSPGTDVNPDPKSGAPAPSKVQAPDPRVRLQQVRMDRIIEYAFKKHEEKEEPKAETGRAVQPVSIPSVKPAEPVNAAPLYSIPDGTIVPATLTSRINGEQSGFFDAVVSEDARIPGTGHIVIPRGARVLGESERVTGFGARRLGLIVHKIQIFPQMESHCDIQIDTPGLDQTGTAGVTGKVNNHTASLILSAAVVALIQGASMGVTYGGTYGTEQVLLGNLSSSSAQVTARLLDRFTSQPASIIVPEGQRLKLVFRKDTPSSCVVNQ